MAIVVGRAPVRPFAVAGPRPTVAGLPSARPIAGAAVSVSMAAKGFGYARYVQAMTDAGAVLDAGAKTPLAMTVDPVASRYTLRPPFDPVRLWDGAILRTQAHDDVIALRLNVTVTTMVAGGSVSLEVDTIGGPPALQSSGDLPGQVGSTQVVSFSSIIVASGAILASAGARLFLTSTVPVRIGPMILVLAPLDSGS